MIVLVMVVVVLLQEPRSGGGLGIALGGGVENMIGVKTAPTFFTNLTVGLGAAFGLLALVLSLLSGAGTSGKTAVERAVGKGAITDILREIQMQTPTQPTTQPESPTTPALPTEGK